jgi:hypothetical protein
VLVRFTVPGQLSVAVGAVHVTTAWQEAPADTVISAGQPANTGAVLSATVTLKLHVEVFPFASVAV